MKVANKSKRKVDTSANNFKITFSNIGKHTKDSTADILELPEDHLDFEPEDDFTSYKSKEEEANFENNISSNYNFSKNITSCDKLETFSDVSGIVSRGFICNSINQYGEKNSNVSKSIITNNSTDGITTFSHNSEFLHLPPQICKAEDGRDNYYLSYTLSGPTMIDSSSSASGSESFNFDQNEMEEDESVNPSETEYDINSEDENRLLGFYESEYVEENQDIDNLDLIKHTDQLLTSKDIEEDIVEPLVFCDKSLRTSGYNIIIQTVQNNKRFVLDRNGWKKTKKKLKSVDKKWLLHYKPCQQIKLFLEDIGYTPKLHSLCESSSHSESETSMESNEVSSLSKTRFQITWNSLKPDEKRKCNESGFKVPLPPIKRPPTRPKRSNSVSSNETINNFFEDTSETATKEDDVISILASSIDCADHDYQDSIKEETFSDEKCTTNNINLIPNGSFVQNWISSLSTTEPVPLDFPNVNLSNSTSNLPRSPKTNSHTSPACNSSLLQMEYSQLQANPSSTSKETDPVRVFSALSGVGVRIKFNDIPKFFSGICFHYYFNERCIKVNCSLPHMVRENIFLKKCKDLTSTEELQKLYIFSVRFHVLFKDIYKVFLKAFGHFNMHKELINSIHHFSDLKEKIDFSTAVKCVVEALQDTGLNLLEAVEKISFNIGLLQYPNLANILLDILTFKNNIMDHWEIIKKICRAINFISPEFFERILSRLLLIEKPNSDILKDIYNVVVKNNITDLSKVDPQLLNPIKCLVEFGDNSMAKATAYNSTGNAKANNSTDNAMANNSTSIAMPRSSTDNVMTNNSIGNVIAKNLSIEREIFERSTQNVDNQSSTVEIDRDTVSDLDERFHSHGMSNNHLTQRSNHEERNSRSSRFSNSRENSWDPYQVEQENSYEYVPQAISYDHMSGIVRITVPNQISSETHDSPQTTSLSQSRNVPVAIPEDSGYLDAPIFGKFRFKKGFNFDNSLHHLLPLDWHQVSISESHIIELNRFIKNKSGSGFLRLLELYKSPSTLQHFITMSIAEIKSCREPCNEYLDLLENIAIIEPNFKKISLLKGVLEVIAFNLILLFVRKCQWIDAKRLVEVFNDWDSLISSKQFGIKKLTPMGRYILLSKVLTKSKAFYYAYEILQSPDLNLLNSPDTWPLFKVKIDLETRNEVLKEFFKYAYKRNVEVVCDIYKRIFQFGNIYAFDAYSYFNPMLESLLNNEKCLLLKYFYSNIDIFYKKMERNIFRAFTIFMENTLSSEEMIKLYEYGCLKGIYRKFTGKEQIVIVRTNMPDNEIKLILKYYFTSLSRLSPYEVNHNLVIEIKLPDGIVESPIILKCFRSICELNNSVRKLLNDFFQIKSVDYVNNNTVVTVQKEELRKMTSS